MRIKFILLLMLLLVGCNMDVVIESPTQSGSGSNSGNNSSNNQPTVPASTIPMPANLPGATVVKVVDGDTVDVSINGKTSRVRMIGINTPESVDPRRPVQCFGTEASNRLKQLLSGQSVFLEEDLTQSTFDQYGRRLDYIWMQDGRMANLVMLAEGYANEYTYDTPYKYQRQFKAAARQADQNQLGLWSPQTCNGDFNSPTQVH